MDDQTEWAVAKAYASEKSAIGLTVTLARAMRVAAISVTSHGISAFYIPDALQQALSQLVKNAT
jgi:hypothetical protein